MGCRLYIEQAKAYVEYSNAHDVERIAPMLAAAATYHSSNVGKFETRASILEMMTGFFTRFPDVTWSVLEYVHDDESSVYFDFVLTALDTQTGETIERRGHERIDFTPSGLIEHIEVGSR
jgi:hypothetical protein